MNTRRGERLVAKEFALWFNQKAQMGEEEKRELIGQVKDTLQ
jgi:hypothetical protein